MKYQNRKTIATLLVVQTIITVVYAFSLFEVCLFYFREGGFTGIKEPLLNYFPHLVILICSIWPQAALLFKHKLHSQDGEIMPLLFTMIATQASLIVTDAVTSMGFIFIFPEQLLVVQRFSLVATAALFLLSSLRYYGFSSSNMGFYTALFLAISLLLSSMVPFSSYRGQMSTLTPGYEVYIQIVVLVLYLVSIITFIITAVKDKTSLNVKRSIAFILLVISIYFSYYNTLYSAIIAVVLAIPATIILSINAGDSL